MSNRPERSEGSVFIISPMQSSNVTLGILAGGQGTRLGGIDKAWLQRGGIPQVLRWQRRFEADVNATLVSANRNLPRHAQAGLQAVTDRFPGNGPLAGLDALAHACTTSWLLTLPVDLVDVNECLLPTLRSGAGARGAYAQDDDGVQPLVALWTVMNLRSVVTEALGAGDLAVHHLSERLNMVNVRFHGVRFGNLNTPADLLAAGAQDEGP